MKNSRTEQSLINALDKLVSGTPSKSDGRLTQKNIALEAGVSRATFNRYPKVVAEYQKYKMCKESPGVEKPFTIMDKNHELQEANTALRRTINQKEIFQKNSLAAARQEIFILNAAIQARDKKISEKDREISELVRKILDMEKNF